MIRLLCLLLSTLSILLASCGRSDTTSLNGSDIKQLSTIRSSLKKAMLEGDMVTIKQIYSNDYKLVTRKGNLLSRSERIEMLESGKLRYLNLGEESDISVKTYANVAVVRGVVGSAETEFDGERRRSVLRRFTEIWVHENGEWQQIGRQSTAISDSAP